MEIEIGKLSGIRKISHRDLFSIPGIEDVYRTILEGGNPLCPMCGTKIKVKNKIFPETPHVGLTFHAACPACHYPEKEINQLFQKQKERD